MSGKSNPILRYAFRLLFVVAVVALAQFLLLTVRISGAQTNFQRLGPELSTAGEATVRKSIVEALKYDGFYVDPKKISIKKSKTGAATIDLVATKEAKILFFRVSREVKFHTETFYDPAL